MEYYSLNRYLKDTFGRKLYKISIDGGFSCPNRDGTLGTGGCIFCLDGSGAFSQSREESVSFQIDKGKELIRAKMPKTAEDGEECGSGHAPGYIAYFQSYTGTYAPVEYLRRTYMEAAGHPDVAVVSIATRPDCLGPEVLSLLSELKEKIPVWVELGLQTSDDKTAEVIHRGYPTEVYDEAAENLKAIGIPFITHVILGLPGENEEKMLESVRHTVQAGSWGIKLQLLHILEGTPLAEMYRSGKVRPLTLEEYGDLMVKCLKLIPGDMVVHRITGDGDKKHLLAPLWSGDKKRVLNYLNKLIAEA